MLILLPKSIPASLGTIFSSDKKCRHFYFGFGLENNQIRILTRDAAAEFVRELLNKVIVETVLKWSKDNYWSCVF